MQMHASTGCVLMASGLSTRFGSNKLLAPFDGQPLLCRAFAATDTPAGTIPCGWDFRRCWHSIRN